jgi:hypothetical protein
MMIGELVGKDLEGVGRSLIAIIKQHLLGGTEENMKNLIHIDDVPAKIRTQCLPDTSPALPKKPVFLRLRSVA